MLSDVEKGRNLTFARLTPVSTLIDTKQQSEITNFSTHRFRDICETGVMHFFLGFSGAITKTGRQSNL